MTETSIEMRVAALLSEYKLQLGIAESCTGGLMGHRITDVPGSSTFFRGGIVAYSYAAKEALLGVEHQTLLQFGAVSAEVAAQMAKGALQAFQCDYALSITGIAGPGGGMPGKPVGLTYIGLAYQGKTLWQKHIWNGTRAENKEKSVAAALKFLQDTILIREGAVHVGARVD